MSRLDQHVAVVRRKLLLGRFLHRLVTTLTCVAIVITLMVLANRLLGMRLPRWEMTICGGLLLAVGVAWAWALRKAPTTHEAAVIIDERLALKEKFSSALHLRNSDDVFARAAVHDAEQTADSVSLHKRFPLQMPRRSWSAGVAMAVAALSLLVPSVDLLGKQKAQAEQAVANDQKAQVEEVIQHALEQIQAIPEEFADAQEIKDAQAELEALLNTPPEDLRSAERSAMKASQKAEESVKEQMQNSQKLADAKQEARAFRAVAPKDDEQGKVAEARQAMAAGEFGEAADRLKELADEFNSMSAEEQQQAAGQMQALADQLDQIANDPMSQQQMQQQLQQMGATPQQAQQMMQQMQQAAQGNQQAQQQLQQSMQQLSQQMNNGQGASPQQQQQMQQQMQQMQAQANTQQKAQQMSQSANQMCQGMGQCQNGGAGQSQQGAQQMAQAQSSMAQQMQQMQGGGQQPGQPTGAMSTSSGQGSGAGRGQGNHGQGAADPNHQFAAQAEQANSTGNTNGPILAKFLVKDSESLPGESRQQLRDIAEAAQNGAADEVQTQRISREAQSAVKGYFSSMGEDAPQ